MRFMRVSERIIQQSDAYIAKKLVRHIMGRSAEELVLAYDHVLTDIEFADLDALMKRCEIGEPLAYVLGYELFGGYHFAVDERVLIPRSETEELVQYVYDMVYDDSIIIDVGTGSGCVGISLALACGSNQRTYLLDISEDALQVAIHNMNYLAVDHDIIFSTSDMLDAVNGLAHTNQHRLVVSNAPYIPHAYDGIEDDVHQREPHLALYSGDDGLDHYRKLLEQLITWSGSVDVVIELMRAQAYQLSESPVWQGLIDCGWTLCTIDTLHPNIVLSHMTHHD